jgi:phage tail sheath gpL-like
MIGKAHAIAKFREWENLVLVEDFNQFKADLVVERNAQNPNRLDFLLPVNLVNQFLQAGVKLGFIL